MKHIPKEAEPLKNLGARFFGRPVTANEPFEFTSENLPVDELSDTQRSIWIYAIRHLSWTRLSRDYFFRKTVTKS